MCQVVARETRVSKAFERIEHLIKIYINFPNVSFMNDLNDLIKETHNTGILKP